MGAAVTVALPDTVTNWGADLLKLPAVRVGLPDDAAITVKIRYGDDGDGVMMVKRGNERGEK